MAGWRVGFVLGRADVVGALAKLKSYLDYGTFQPIQIAVDGDAARGRRLPGRGLRDLPEPPRRADAAGSRAPAGRSSRRAARCSCGRRSPSRSARSAPSSSPLRLAREADVAVSPGIGFGDGGDGHVRFALVENEQRIGQATRAIRRLLQH